jgi:hypothetical protein
MEVIPVSLDEYKANIPQPYVVYNQADFNAINQGKCDTVVAYLIKEQKFRLGIIGGISGTEFKSPFSAPFGGFSFVNEKTSLHVIEDAISTFEEYLFSNGLFTIKIIYPPLFYHPVYLSKIINVHYRKHYSISNADIDYFFRADNLDETYKNQIWQNARKNLNIGLNSRLDFTKEEGSHGITEVYDIIRSNRQLKGYPLKMTFDDVIRTSHYIKADFFRVSMDGKGVSSAIVFWVSSEIVQVIYWGDLPGYSSFKPMNFLAYRLFEYYKNMGVRIIDIGPSTENSLPNYGLCDFKESIGCTTEIKFTFQKKLS